MKNVDMSIEKEKVTETKMRVVLPYMFTDPKSNSSQISIKTLSLFQ